MMARIVVLLLAWVSLVQLVSGADVCIPENLRDPMNGEMTCTAKAGDAGYDCNIQCDSDHVLYDPFGGSSTTLSCDTGQAFPDAVDCLPAEAPNYFFHISATYTSSSTINWASCQDEYRAEFIAGQEAVAAALSDFSTTNFAFIYGVDAITIVALTSDEFLTVEEGSPTTVDVTYTFEIQPSTLDPDHQKTITTLLHAIIASAGGMSEDMVQLPGTADCPAVVTNETDISDIDTTTSTTGQRCLEPLFLYEADNVCVPCPYGYFYDSGSCTSCEPDTYQSDVKQYSCVSCPVGTSTPSRGAVAEEDCEDDEMIIALIVAVTTLSLAVVVLVFLRRRRCCEREREKKAIYLR